MIQHQCPTCKRVFTSPQYAQSVKCPYCGTTFPPQFNQNYQQGFQQGYNDAMRYNRQPGVFDNGPSGKSRGVAALLAIFLGGIGIHYFYLGKNTAGIIFLLCTLCSFGLLWFVTHLISFVQGIYMLTITESEFERKYIYSRDTVPFF